MVFTSEQRAFVLMAHFRSGTRNADGIWVYSLQSCFDQFSEQYPEVNIDYETFGQHKRSILKRFENKHCICKGKSTGRPSVLTELDDIQRRIDQSPTKSLRKLSCLENNGGHIQHLL